ncbi:hypothetical protein EIT90_21080 [Salmonella enterica]|uniref:Uncharacterized protein n=2 Tax=Salmonella enterica TaxID=28901 RepID=A0A5T5TYR7_SALER|nr:hypothetical protein [Salmonella enterica]EBW2477111.1 hypothetical protein [Salmonella enterica subsp. enterica serovar Typhi]MBW8070110.1 hypothetical protein [Salmonella enterica subsp. enterica serovar Fulica]HAD4682000.1 hypothetical protein [Salmonella enterica subsp. enterica serovar Typhi str. CT18]EAB4560438.1 hypothetical protein [Salmonella enterica]
MLIQSRPPGRLFFMPLTGRCLTPWRLLVTPGVYEIGRDNTYGWRRYGRDNMTTNSITTK